MLQREVDSLQETRLSERYVPLEVIIWVAVHPESGDTRRCLATIETS